VPSSIPAVVLASLLRVASTGAEDVRAVPVLVELFTSEGCSSCPPADRHLARLLQEQPVPGARVIALGEHVDYWDDLGWKDAFSSPLFTKRQQDYVRRLGLAGLYTPQLVVGGRLQAVGGDESAARSAIAQVARSSAGSLALRIAIDAGGEPVLDIQAKWAGGDAQIVVAVVEDRATTQVRRGENAGRTLAHVSAARSMVTVGRAAGTFSGRVGLGRVGVLGPAHAVVFVQEPGGGHVHAADSIALPGPPRAAAASSVDAAGEESQRPGAAHRPPTGK
jgi:hypothetical protein